MPSSEILSLLYVGDEIAAIAPEVHKFGCVLNITEEVPKSALLEDDVLFQRFSIFDMDGSEQEQAQMLSFFPTTCAIIKQQMELKRPGVGALCGREAAVVQRGCGVHDSGSGFYS